jgi:hypothetical protein
MPYRGKFFFNKKFYILLDFKASKNLELYTSNKEKYLKERMRNLLSRKDSEMDNPYNKKIIERIKSAKIPSSNKSHKIIKSFTKFELSGSMMSDSDMPIITDILSPKGNIRKNLRSAITKQTFNLMTESIQNLPTNVSIIPQKRRVESAALKKSIIDETDKKDFFKCLEISKDFMLRNNPNACIKEVARVYGSYKYIHKKY